MSAIFLKTIAKLRELALHADGQDMVEYALVIGMLCLGATASSRFLAAGLASAFTGLSTTLGSYTS